MDLGLHNKVFVVTGATRGLGFATAKALVGEGARVVLSGRNAESVDAAVGQLGRVSCLGIVADNGDPETPGRLIAAARARWTHLDGACISVGGPPAGGALDVSDDAWRDNFETIFLGAVRTMRDVISQCEDDSSIVLVLSTSVRVPIPGLAISNALRPALAMLAKDLADELGPRGIRINGLMPGRIETERMRELDRIQGDPELARARGAATIPLRRYGRPDEFGAVATFLLSSAASYLTGCVLAVDGGATRAL
jgi:3-oxoacyl-[acyl-carrier protein] reductase